MSNNTVTQERINHLMKTAKYQLTEVFGKCTILTVQLENGFVLLESSACVDPKNYDIEIGREICMKRIESRLWELEGYALSKSLFENGVSHEECSSI